METLVCIDCGKTHSADVPIVACDCGGLLDLDFTPAFDRDAIASRKPTMWRYREALPIPESAKVSFDEGFTPLLPVKIGGREVLVKQEQLFQSGSYKDRGASVMISKAASMGVKSVVEDSSGNAGCAVAAYCARAGISCRIFVPADASVGKLAQIALYGAALTKVPGSREAAAAAVLDAAKEAFYASHCYNPYFFQGTKTFAYEVAEQLGWLAPDALVLPAGNGTLLLGAHLGFTELFRAGLVASMPRLIAVQAANCAPLAEAFASGAADVREISTKPTLAEGIAIAAPVRARQMLKAVRETGGEFLAVAEADIKTSLLAMARKGFYIEPTSAAVIAGTERFAAKAAPETRIVTAFTGHGLKATEKLSTLV